MKTIRRGGRYARVASPSWEDPLDGRYSMRHGGRWNAPGSFPVVYLNNCRELARAQVLRKLEGAPFAPDDLFPGPSLVLTDVPNDEYVDVVTACGCKSVGLPATYPKGIGHLDCQAIGKKAWDAGYPGIACRSAAPLAPPGSEELAWFQRDGKMPEATEILDFETWFLKS